MTRYLKNTTVFTNGSGTRTRIWDYDPDSGAIAETIIDSPGYVHGGGSSITTLTVPYTLTDLQTRWQARFEALAPLATLDELTTITARPLIGGSEVDHDVDWWSKSGNNYIKIKPEPVNPWDGTYRIVSYDSYEDLNAAPANTFPLGSMPSSSSATISGATSYYDLVYKGWDMFVATCQAYPLGLGCAAVDDEDHDAVRLTVNTSTAEITASWGLELDPGTYSFNGSDFEIHFGSVVSGTPTVSGIGSISRRREEATPTQLWENTDSCPP